MSDPSPTVVTAPSARLSGAVRAALLLSLVAFFCGVLLQLIAVAALLGVLVGAIAEAPLLSSVGALDGDLPEATTIGLVLPSLVVAAALAWRAAHWVFAKATKRPSLKLPWYGSRLYAYLAVWLAYKLLVRMPLDARGILDDDDGMLGGALLSVVVLAALLLSWQAKTQEAVRKVFDRAVATLQEDLPPACL